MSKYIGGVPRVIGQVEFAHEMGEIDDSMTVGEILEKSRATRLINKEYQKYASDIVAKLVGGGLENKFVSLPNVDWKSDEYSKIKGAYEIAKNLELDYADQASALI